MDCLNKHDVREIIEMLEDGLHFVPKLSAADKMRMRSQIRRQDNWLLDLKKPTTKSIFMKLDVRLSDVFRLYPYGFSDKLKEKLDAKLAMFHKKAAAIRPIMASCQSNMDDAHEPEQQAA